MSGLSKLGTMDQTRVGVDALLPVVVRRPWQVPALCIKCELVRVLGTNVARKVLLPLKPQLVCGCNEPAWRGLDQAQSSGGQRLGTLQMERCVGYVTAVQYFSMTEASKEKRAKYATAVQYSLMTDKGKRAER
jgi:hypothetical protein